MKSIVFLSIGFFLFYCELDAKSAKNIIATDIPIPDEPIALGKTLTNTTIEKLISNNRNGVFTNTVVEMVNHLDAPITKVFGFVRSGLNSITPPDPIPRKTKEVFVFEESLTTATGPNALVVYKVEGISDIEFAVLFSVPFSYHGRTPWCLLKWTDGLFFQNLDHSYFLSDSELAISNHPTAIYNEGYVVRASIIGSVITVNVYKESEAPEDYDGERAWPQSGNFSQMSNLTEREHFLLQNSPPNSFSKPGQI